MSQRVRHLRELAVDTAIPLEVWIPTTVEYQHYRRADLVWQWGAKVSADEAILACKLIVLAMRGGNPVDWQMEARKYLNEARAHLGIKPPEQGEAGNVAEVVPVEAPRPAPEGPEGQVEGPGQEGGEVGPDNDETIDPGIPGNLQDVVDQAKKLAELLAKTQPDTAQRVGALADLIGAGLVSLAAVAGVFMIAIEYAPGKVIVVWSPLATESPDFARRAARAERIIAQLNANLSELDKIKADVGPEWVDEIADMGEAAREYQDGAEGTRSNIHTGNRQAPVVNGVRFDGWDGDVLIDRKTSVTSFAKTKNQAMRQSHALAKSGMRAVWEVPNEAQARKAQSLLSELGITNITARIAP
jgi:hypothetical protein